jgi:putative hydrolase of the HAD superfamily
MTDGVVIFDGDDTLWETEFLYDQARDDAAALVATTGIDPAAFVDRQREIDVRNVARLGLRRTRFPTSSVDAYRELAGRRGDAFSDRIAERVFEASAAVFERRAPLVDGVADVLEQVGSHHDLALLTKGDPDVQERRIADSGLRDCFRVVSVVDEKDAASFVRVLRALAAEASTAWSVGNSVRSDILPALTVGMRAVWVDAHVWAHERPDEHRSIHHPDVRVAANLREVPALIDAAAVHHVRGA